MPRYNAPILTPNDPDPSEFENFKPKAGARDYAIYAAVVVLLAAVAGGAVYYYTRTQPEREKLLAMFGFGKEAELRQIERRSDPRLDAVLGDGPEVPARTVPVDETPKPKPALVAVSAYAGGGRNGVTLSDDPKRPRATVEFVAFVEALKVSSVMAGTPAKAMCNGRVVREGDVLDDALGVVFSGVDGVKKHLVLTDATGAQVYLSY